MKLCLISDLHGYLPEVPKCSVLVIAGDICPVQNHDMRFQKQWLAGPFAEWLKDVDAGVVVATAGNHDWIFQKRPRWVPMLPWILRIDCEVDVEGVRFWGSPWQPEFCDWAFNANDADLAAIHATIPACDVLITHGPPYGHCDTAKPGQPHLGSKSLLSAIERIKPRLVVCGHIHGGAGMSRHGETDIVNASLLDESYRPRNAPVIYDLST